MSIAEGKDIRRNVFNERPDIDNDARGIPRGNGLDECADRLGFRDADAGHQRDLAAFEELRGFRRFRNVDPCNVVLQAARSRQPASDPA
jgi:hypothetical protein